MFSVKRALQVNVLVGVVADDQNTKRQKERPIETLANTVIVIVLAFLVRCTYCVP